jgi:hypothetical protein
MSLLMPEVQRGTASLPLTPITLDLQSNGVTTEILTLCFAARPGVHGEINILGATDMIIVLQFPIGISCFIVGKLRFQKI